MKEENWKSLSFKEKCLYVTALSSFFIGFFLTIYNFFDNPEHIVADTTLWVLSQCLIYTGSALGISAYLNSQITTINNKLKEYENKYSKEKD